MALQQQHFVKVTASSDRSPTYLEFTRQRSRTQRKLLIPHALALSPKIHDDEVGRQHNDANACLELEDYHFGVIDSVPFNLQTPAVQNETEISRKRAVSKKCVCVWGEIRQIDHGTWHMPYLKSR